MKKINTGWKTRLEILERDLAEYFIRPLETHGWEHSHHDVENGEYLILEAKRGEKTHKVALMYSSATSNAVYKTLQSKVERIFLHGGKYKIESFTQGVTIPINVKGDFHSVLISWNKECGDTTFLEELSTPADPDDSDDLDKYHRIRAEDPLKNIWLKLHQYESVTLAKKLVANRVNRANVRLDPDVVSSKGEGLAFALRNASEYFQSRSNQNVNQRILNLYYGSLSFAFSEMLADPTGPSDLAQIENYTKWGHGLYTMDGNQGGLELLVVGCLTNGFFSNYLKFLGSRPKELPQRKPKEHADLEKIGSGMWTTFESLFSRVPELDDLFAEIFESSPSWLLCVYDQDANPRPSLKEQAPADRTYVRLIDRSRRIDIERVPHFSSKLVEICKVGNPGETHFRAAVDHSPGEHVFNSLPLHSSPFFQSNALVEPVFGTVHEYRCLCIVILYALSIIVRYRPSIWRRVQEGDLDHMKVLIAAFLDVAERVLPEQYLAKILGKKVFANQSGSIFG